MNDTHKDIDNREHLKGNRKFLIFVAVITTVIVTLAAVLSVGTIKEQVEYASLPNYKSSVLLEATTISDSPENTQKIQEIQDQRTAEAEAAAAAEEAEKAAQEAQQAAEQAASEEASNSSSSNYQNIVVDTSNVSRDIIVAIAKKYLGCPYKHAGADPATGFSCDNFTWYVYNEAGVKVCENPNVNRSYYGQSAYLKSIGKMVYSVDELKAGDIVYFGSSWSNMRHAAIYIGNDQIIHAIDSSHGVGTTSLSAEINSTHDFLGGGSPLT